jgi:E3 ubiquitin-protein ligase HERC2
MVCPETNVPCSFCVAAMGSACTDTREMLLELCVTELEDVALNTHSMHLAPQPVVQESSHPYTDDATLSGHVKVPGKAMSM